VRAAAAWSRRHARALVVTGFALLVTIGLGVAVSWHFSSVALVPDHSEWPLETRVEAVGLGRIVLSRDDHSSQPGIYGLDWQAGHAIVGSILTEGDNTITRRLRDVHGYLVPEIKVGFDSHVYSGDPGETLGLPFRSVDVPDPLGPMPAWLIPAAHDLQSEAGGTWAIVVHGHNDNRQNDLRIAPTLRKAGLTSLLISYRNDLGAPRSPDGLYHLGETEWEDLAAAIHYALAHGAHKIALIGYSMGGALITQLMERSPLASRVDAIVLDAPVLDWRSLLEFNAERMDLPGFLSLPVQLTIDARIDPNWNSLDALDHTEDFHLPILLFHTAEDDLVPISTSEAFAKALPHWVTYHRIPTGGHTEAWNVAPRTYEHRLENFLNQISAVRDGVRRAWKVVRTD
jgi:pimeloyl-ACP methyl ester carboxylesterase